MTPKEKRQFNKMLQSLKIIAKAYQTPKMLKKESEQQYGLSYEESIEMAYENIQSEAKFACKGVKFID